MGRKMHLIRGGEASPWCSGVDVRSMVCGMVENNVYIVNRMGSDQAVVIDPAGDGSQVLEYLDELGLKCAAILLTHGHFDHIEGVSLLRQESGAPVYISREDAPLLTDAALNSSAGLLGYSILAGEADHLFEDGNRLSLAGLEFKVIATPGHTPGGCCFLMERVLFSGDTLFYGSVGRSDLAGGSESTLHRSVQKLFDMEGDCVVFAGHGSVTTLQDERRQNLFMKYYRGE